MFLFHFKYSNWNRCAVIRYNVQNANYKRKCQSRRRTSHAGRNNTRNTKYKSKGINYYLFLFFSSFIFETILMSIPKKSLHLRNSLIGFGHFSPFRLLHSHLQTNVDGLKSCSNTLSQLHHINSF